MVVLLPMMELCWVMVRMMEVMLTAAAGTPFVLPMSQCDALELAYRVTATVTAAIMMVMVAVVWRWMVRRWRIGGRAAGLRSIGGGTTLLSAGGDIMAIVGVGHGPRHMVGRCLLYRSRAPRPSLLGEALGLTGSGGRGQAFWARRCQQYTTPASRPPPSGGALGVVVL